MYRVKRCLKCNKGLVGRMDKRFCDHNCRSGYHNELYREELMQLKRINKILKRNRRILESLNPFSKTMVHRSRLLMSGFDFDYITHLYEGVEGREYRFCYEYGYAFGEAEEVEVFCKKS